MANKKVDPKPIELTWDYVEFYPGNQWDREAIPILPKCEFSIVDGTDHERGKKVLVGNFSFPETDWILEQLNERLNADDTSKNAVHLHPVGCKVTEGALNTFGIPKMRARVYFSTPLNDTDIIFNAEPGHGQGNWNVEVLANDDYGQHGDEDVFLHELSRGDAREDLLTCVANQWDPKGVANPAPDIAYSITNQYAFGIVAKPEQII